LREREKSVGLLAKGGRYYDSRSGKRPGRQGKSRKERSHPVYY